MTPLYKILYPVAWLFMKIFCAVKIVGREKISASKKLVVCANHISFADPIFVGLAFGHKRQVYYMAKDELFANHRFLGGFIKALGAFSVKRGVGAKSGIKEAERLVNQNKIIGIFPEGTRSRDGKPGKAKSGIAMITAATGADIQPMVIITKKQRVRIFRRVTVYICDAIDAKMIAPGEGGLKDLRRISEVIMSPILKTIEKSGVL